MSAIPIVHENTLRPNRSDDDSDTNSQGRSEKPDVVPAALIDNADLVTEKGNVITRDGEVISTRDSDSSLSTNIFSDPEIKAYYLDVYEKAKYECRHVFDADFQWSKEEEKALVRRLDWHGVVFHLEDS